jgi:hypothetical protein
MTERDAWLANQPGLHSQPLEEPPLEDGAAVLDWAEWTAALSALHTPLYVRARAVHISYPDLTISQYADAGWAWVRGHTKRVLAAWDDQNPSPFDSATGQRLVRAIERYMEATGRREKAALAGYRVEDEAFYPKTLIEMALPALWDVSIATSAPIALDENAGDGYLPPKRLSDPAEGNNWLASVVDVRQAYQETVLSEDQKHWLKLRYYNHLSVEDVARSLGLGAEYVNHQLEAALRKIQRTLGGERPTGCSSSCECGGSF